MRTSRFASWMVVLVAGILCVGVKSQGQEDGGRSDLGYRRIQLDPSPRWISSAIAGLDDQSFLVVDALRSAVVRFSVQTGHRLETMTGAAVGSSKAFRPSLVQRSGEGYLVQTDDTVLRVQEHAGALAVPETASADPTRAPIDFLGVNRRTGQELVGVFNWAKLPTGFLVFADLKQTDGSFTSGFVWVPEDTPLSFQLVHEVPYQSNERQLYLLLESFIAANLASNSADFLALGPTTAVYRFSPGHGVEKAFDVPVSNQVLPTIPQGGGVKSIPGRYQALEAARMAVGLFATEPGGELVVLERRPGSKAGETSWNLLRLAGRDGKVLSASGLPTTAPHLSLVPGGSWWVAIERGHVEELWEQATTSALVIPSSSVFR